SRRSADRRSGPRDTSAAAPARRARQVPASPARRCRRPPSSGTGGDRDRARLPVPSPIGSSEPGSRLASLRPRDGFDGIENPGVRAAPAEVVLQPYGNRLAAGRRILVKKGGGREDHSRRTVAALEAVVLEEGDRKSTRLNSSHDQISYAVF